jgi:hypothetical protein
VFNADRAVRQTPAGFFQQARERTGASPRAQNDDFPHPAGIQVFGVRFHKGKGGGNIGLRLQGVHQQHTANYRLQIPPALNAAGNLHPGCIRKSDKMERIAQMKIVAQE